MNNNDFKFLISLSTKPYDSKPDVSKILFRQVETTPTELLKKHLEGYSSVGVFEGTESLDFNKGFRRLTNFKQTNTIYFDIDDTTSSLTLMEFINLLTYKPTFAYETFSHNQPNKGFRYRLVYVFKNPITGVYRFEGYYKLMHELICCDTVNVFTGDIDNAMLTPTQPAHGTHHYATSYYSGLIYDDNEIFTDEMFIKYNIDTSLFDKPYHSYLTLKLKSDVQLSDEFKDDFFGSLNNQYLSYKDLFEKYAPKYFERIYNGEHKETMTLYDKRNFPYTTQLNFGLNEPYKIIDMYDENQLYFEIKFHQYQYKGKKTWIINDGHKRRQKLLKYGTLIVINKPYIDIDELTFLLGMMVYTRFQNEGVLNRKYIYDVAQSILVKNGLGVQYGMKKQDVEYYKKNNKRRYKIIANPTYCDISGVNSDFINKNLSIEYNKLKKIIEEVDIYAEPFFTKNTCADNETLKKFMRMVLGQETRPELYRSTKNVRNQLLNEVINEYLNKNNLTEEFNMKRLLTDEEFVQLIDKEKSLKENYEVFYEKTGGAMITFRFYCRINNIKFRTPSGTKCIKKTTPEWKTIADYHLPMTELINTIQSQFPEISRSTIKTWKYRELKKENNE